MHDATNNVNDIHMVLCISKATLKVFNMHKYDANEMLWRSTQWQHVANNDSFTLLRGIERCKY